MADNAKKMLCGILECWDCYGLATVLNKTVKYLGLPEVVEEGRGALKKYLEENYGGWKEIVRKGVEQGINAALGILEAAKEEIVKVCRKYKPLIVQLTKLAVKSAPKLAAEVGVKTLAKGAVREATKTATKTVVKEATKTATKTVVKEATKTATKTVVKEATVVVTKRTVKGATMITVKGLTKTASTTTVKGAAKAATKSAAKGASAVTSKALFKAANPVGIVADVAQAGLELAGQEEAGRVVGISGNIASGAMMGGVLGGPPGAAIGAGVGFAMWATGEVAGGLTGRFIDWMSGPS